MSSGSEQEDEVVIEIGGKAMVSGGKPTGWERGNGEDRIKECVQLWKQGNYINH